MPEYLACSLDFVDLESMNIFRYCGDDEYGQGVVQAGPEPEY